MSTIGEVMARELWVFNSRPLQILPDLEGKYKFTSPCPSPFPFPLPLLSFPLFPPTIYIQTSCLVLLSIPCVLCFWNSIFVQLKSVLFCSLKYGVLYFPCICDKLKPLNSRILTPLFS